MEYYPVKQEKDYISTALYKEFQFSVQIEEIRKMRTMLTAIWILQVATSVGLTMASKIVYIGALLNDGGGSDHGVAQRSLELAINYVNSRPDILPNITLDYVTSTSTNPDTFKNIQMTCSQIERGVIAIIGPPTSSSVQATHPLCAGLHLPQITPTASSPTLSLSNEEYPYLIKMSAPDDIQSMAIVDVVKHFSWTHFALLSSKTEYGRNALVRFQTEAIKNNWAISIISYFDPHPTKINVMKNLLAIKHTGARIILLTCMAGTAKIVLEEATSLGMTSSGWAWIVTDGVTTFEGLYCASSDVPKYLHGLLGTRPAHHQTEFFPTYIDMWQDTYSNTKLKGYPMRIFDSVLALAYGLHDYLRDGHNITSPNFSKGVCQNLNATPWVDGDRLIQYIANVDGPGVMNHIDFNHRFSPVSTDFDIVNLQKDGWKTVAQWSATKNNSSFSFDFIEWVVFPGGNLTYPKDMAIDMSNITLRIVTILMEPFVVRTSESERKNQPGVFYKGYCFDLLHQLQQSLHFKYTVYEVEDGNYGAQDPNTGEWNGMVHDIVAEKADMILGALTISSTRQQYIDFTIPYKDLGLLILMAKESPQLTILTFLEPFDWPLWIAVVGAFIFSGIAVTVCSFCSPYGSHGRDVQSLNRGLSHQKKPSNTFHLYNSLWYSYSAWMLQGNDVAPRSFSGRLILGCWWFAVMVISATYTANLAAILTVERLDTGVNSLEDLAAQRDIKYGTLANTAVQTFFEEQVTEPYISMSSYMQTESSNVKTSAEGIQRVADSYSLGKGHEEKYAFILDSAPLEYAANKKPCHMRLVGRLFNNFGYGLAFKKNSPFTDLFSINILKLREKGTLATHWNRWKGGSCQSADSSGSTTLGKKTTLESMAGVFYMLAIGVVAGLLLVICEFCFASLRESRHSKKEQNQNNRICWSIVRRRCSAIGREMQGCCCPCCLSTPYPKTNEEEIPTHCYTNNIQEMENSI